MKNDWIKICFNWPYTAQCTCIRLHALWWFLKPWRPPQLQIDVGSIIVRDFKTKDELRWTCILHRRSFVTEATFKITIINVCSFFNITVFADMSLKTEHFGLLSSNLDISVLRQIGRLWRNTSKIFRQSLCVISNDSMVLKACFFQNLIFLSLLTRCLWPHEIMSNKAFY